MRGILSICSKKIEGIRGREKTTDLYWLVISQGKMYSTQTVTEPESTDVLGCVFFYPRLICYK